MLLPLFMELFLPIHYRIGVGFEETLRCGQLSRKQVAILWLMRAEGGPEGSMRRKDIERLLASWFETSSSTITRSLAALARAPLKLVRVREDPDSGREKRVVLTAKGEQFLAGMAGEGRAFTQKLLDGMPRQETQEMVRLMQKAIGILEQDGAERNSACACRRSEVCQSTRRLHPRKSLSDFRAEVRQEPPR